MSGQTEPQDLFADERSAAAPSPSWWRRLPWKRRVRADGHDAPLLEADAVSGRHEPMLDHADHRTLPESPAAAPRHRKSWREQRWERRRRRYMFEEILGWILVPIILIAAYWAIDAGLAALGTSPAQVIEGVRMVLGY